MFSYRRDSVRGQGLVEYALILAFVAIAVIVVLGTAGQKVGEVLCDVVIKVGGGNPGNIKLCAAPRVTISGIAGGQTVHGDIIVEAIVQDDKIQQPNDIVSVTFYIDGVAVQTELVYHYCLHGPDSGCDGYDTTQLSNGTHTLRVVAEDADHNLGETTLTFTVKN